LKLSRTGEWNHFSIALYWAFCFMGLSDSSPAYRLSDSYFPFRPNRSCEYKTTNKVVKQPVDLVSLPLSRLNPQPPPAPPLVCLASRHNRLRTRCLVAVAHSVRTLPTSQPPAQGLGRLAKTRLLVKLAPQGPAPALAQVSLARLVRTNNSNSRPQALVHLASLNNLQQALPRARARARVFLVVAHLDKIITRRNQRVLLVLLVIVNAIF
jgi:hypothetical protein